VAPPDGRMNWRATVGTLARRPPRLVSTSCRFRPRLQSPLLRHAARLRFREVGAWVVRPPFRAGPLAIPPRILCFRFLPCRSGVRHHPAARPTVALADLAPPPRSVRARRGQRNRSAWGSQRRRAKMASRSNGHCGTDAMLFLLRCPGKGYPPPLRKRIKQLPGDVTRTAPRGGVPQVFFLDRLGRAGHDPRTSPEGSLMDPFCFGRNKTPKPSARRARAQRRYRPMRIFLDLSPGHLLFLSFS